MSLSVGSPPVIPDALWNINNGPRMLRILTPMLLVVTTSVALRFGVRYHRRAGFGLEDCLVFTSLVSTFRSSTGSPPTSTSLPNIKDIRYFHLLSCANAYLCRTKILAWSVYVIAVCFVNLAGIGRPLLVNLAIDPSRIVKARKVGLHCVPSISK